MADEMNDGGEGIASSDATPSDSQGALSSEQLAQNPEIQAAWSAVFGGEQQPEATGEANATAGEVEETPADNAAAELEGSEPEAKPAPVTKKPAAVKPGSKEGAVDASTLSPVLRQAASRAGWSKEDIEGFYQQNPELAERTFDRLHAAANDLSMRYAQLGAQRLNPQQPGAQPQNQPAAQPQTRQQNQLDALLDDAALKKFGEENGQDFVDKFLKPFKAEVYEPVRQALAYIEGQKAELLGQQVNAVFKELEAEHGDFYGKAGSLNQEQHQARYQMAQLADQIKSGAELQGINLSVQEALNQAHNVVTAHRRAEIERKALTQRITKQSSRITSRPSARRAATTVATGGEKSIEAAMEAYAARASELGLDV